MKIYLAHGRGGSQHSKEIFHLARTAKRAGHTTHCINDTDTEYPELRSARLQRRLYAHITRDVKTLIAIHRKFQTRRVAKGSTRLYGEATQHSMRLSVDGYTNCACYRRACIRIKNVGQWPTKKNQKIMGRSTTALFAS